MGLTFLVVGIGVLENVTGVKHVFRRHNAPDT